MQIRSFSIHQLHSFFSNFNFHALKLWWVSWRCYLRFFTFLPNFYCFYAHLAAPNVGFTFWIHLLAWASHFIDCNDLEQHPLWGFRFFYDSSDFRSFKALKFLFCSCFWICVWSRLGFLFFDVFVHSELKCLIAPFLCLAKFFALVPWWNWNETMRLLVIFGLYSELHLFQVGFWW